MTESKSTALAFVPMLTPALDEMGVLRPSLPHNIFWSRSQQFIPCPLFRDDASS
jgi:hypothetical protein